MRDPLRITFVLPFADLSGGVRVALTYALRLRDRGHRVTVVSQPQGKPGLLRRLRARLRGERPRVRSHHPLVAELGNSHVMLDVARPVTDGDLPDADVVIATWWETAEWVNDLSPSKGSKVHLIQGYEVFPYLPIDRVIRTYRLPFHRIAVSSYLRSEIETNHGTTGIRVVPIATDMADLDIAPRSKAARPTFGFLYSMQSIKNCRLAIDALNMARARDPSLTAVAFGTPAPAPDLPLPDWISYHWRPDQSAIPALYACCDAWLFTSEKEGFGLPILESMACRTPVLATRAGAAPDIVDGKNGWLLDASPEAFAKAIRDVTDMSPERWRQHSDAAHATSRNWTWDAATTAFEDALRSTLA